MFFLCLLDLINNQKTKIYVMELRNMSHFLYIVISKYKGEQLLLSYMDGSCSHSGVSETSDWSTVAVHFTRGLTTHFAWTCPPPRSLCKLGFINYVCGTEKQISKFRTHREAPTVFNQQRK